MPIRKRGQAEARRQDLLETATMFFDRNGFEGTRVDAIAEAARVNKRMIYVYFGSKEALYLAVLHDQLDRVLQIARIAEPTSDDPREEAELIIRRYYAFLASNPRFVRLLNWEFLGDTRAAREVLTSRALQGLEVLHGVLEDGIRRGQFRADLDVRRTILSINALLLGQFTHQKIAEALWRQDLSQPHAREKSLEQALQLVFSGICTPQPPRRAAAARAGKGTASKPGARHKTARRTGVVR